MKKIWKRTLAIMLVALMVGGAAPIGALAELDLPTLPDGAVTSWVNGGVGAVKSAASWLGDKLQSKRPCTDGDILRRQHKDDYKRLYMHGFQLLDSGHENDHRDIFR